jgi:hypothetical protein
MAMMLIAVRRHGAGRPAISVAGASATETHGAPARTKKARNVATYRIYLIDVAERIIESRELSCEGDEAALAIALPFLPTWPLVEIWDDAGRRVVRLTAPRPGSKYSRINRSFVAPKSHRRERTGRAPASKF